MLPHSLRIAWTILSRRRGFAAIGVATVAATLVVVAVAAAMLGQLFGTAPPESRLDRALGLYSLGMYGEHWARTGFPGYGFLDQRLRDLPGVEETTFFALQTPVVSYSGARKVRAWLKRTDGAFWRVFDHHFVEGAPFGDADEREHAMVAVVNESTRDALLGGAPAVGRTIELDGQRFRVVGVVADVPAAKLLPFADVWVPLSTAKSDAWRREWVGDFVGIFLAHSRADFPALRAEVARRIATATPPDPEHFQELRGGADDKFGALSRMLFASRLDAARPARLGALLAGAALLLMLLPAVNLTNLHLARVGERAAEIGVRRAFGAPKRALIGQLLVENLLLSALGGAIGLALAAFVLAAINATGWIPYARFTLSLAACGWTLAATALFGALSGIVPALRLARLAPVTALKGGSR